MALAWLAPTHYLNQCWNIVDQSLGKKKFNAILSNIFIQENAVEYVIQKLEAILSQIQCVNGF